MSSAIPPAAELNHGANADFSLANHFLIAMPNMADPRFSGTVIYVCEHNAKGALGLVINRPTDLTLQSLFDQIDLKLEIAPKLAPQFDMPVFAGGPVQTDRGFVLHDQANAAYNSTLSVAGGLTPSTSASTTPKVRSVWSSIGPPT